jgi:hypothetical protein
MGLFSENNLTIEETVDTVFFVVCMSLRKYALDGEPLSAIERQKFIQLRVKFHNKSISTMRSMKLGYAANDCTKGLMSYPEIVPRVLMNYQGSDEEDTEYFKEYSIDDFVRIYLLKAGLI